MLICSLHYRDHWDLQVRKVHLALREIGDEMVSLVYPEALQPLEILVLLEKLVQLGLLVKMDVLELKVNLERRDLAVNLDL